MSQFETTKRQPTPPKSFNGRSGASPVGSELQVLDEANERSEPGRAGSHPHYSFGKVRPTSGERAADGRTSPAQTRLGGNRVPSGTPVGRNTIVDQNSAPGMRFKADHTGPGGPAARRLLTPPDTGLPLPKEVQRLAERTLQWDFDSVRIHEDPQSASDVNAVGAVAVTHGRHISLGRNAPPPTSRAGRQLLLHELTHVRQQALASSYGRLFSEHGDTDERAANTASFAPFHAVSHASQPDQVAALQRQVPGPVTPGLPPGVSGPAGFDPSAFDWAKIPGEGFGDVVVGGTRLGAGQFGAAVAPASVTGGATVAEGTVVVGSSAVGEGTILAGGTMAVGPLAAAGLVLVGALIVAGTIYLVVSLIPEGAKSPEAGEEYPGTSLPGGAPPPASAPGRDTPAPRQAPGAQGKEPAIDPGVSGRPPATLPGLPSPAPAKEPGVVDDPAECAKLIKAGKTHDHHIFPQEYINEFEAINILVHDYTVTLNAAQHIGSKGIHITMDWNGEWADFFDQVPNDLTPEQRFLWGKKAIEKAIELMNKAGIAWKQVHRFGKPHSIPPLSPPKSK